MFEHIVRQRFRVRIGGWKLGSRSVGGGVYEIGPLSVLRVFQIVAALGSLDLPLDDEDIVRAVEAVPLEIFRAYLPLLFEGEVIKKRHARRVTREQCNTVIEAVKRANDISYILEAFKGKPSQTGDTLVFVHAVVAVSQGAYKHEEVKFLPMQEALAILDADTAMHHPEGIPASEEEKAEVTSLFHKLGFVVN